MAGENAERRAGELVDRALQWVGSQSGKPYLLWVHGFDPHLPYDPPPPFREKYATRPYDGEVAYADHQLERLFDAVGKKSPPESTLIAALSDHGESLGEHGENLDTSKGTIRFPADKPPSAALIRKLVKARIAENEQKKQR